MNHQERRRLLHEAVEQLEPHAHSAAVLEYVRQHHCLVLPLLRIYVDLERLVTDGYLSRQKLKGPSGGKPTFYWETTGKVRVEPERPVPKVDAAEAVLQFQVRQLADAAANLQRSPQGKILLVDGL